MEKIVCVIDPDDTLIFVKFTLQLISYQDAAGGLQWCVINGFLIHNMSLYS